jgi:tRNA U34 2-thiouridine synthase MnmA/TrmU
MHSDAQLAPETGVATGHYARTEKRMPWWIGSSTSALAAPPTLLHRSEDKIKDQTYFLVTSLGMLFLFMGRSTAVCSVDLAKSS